VLSFKHFQNILNEIIDLMISKGANDWNYGLFGACQSKNKEIALLMVKKGADDRELFKKYFGEYPN